MNHDDEVRRIAGVADTDQRAAFIVDIATDVAAYRAQLIKSGVPVRLANELTMQAAAVLWGWTGCGCGDEG